MISVNINGVKKWTADNCLSAVSPFLSVTGKLIMPRKTCGTHVRANYAAIATLDSPDMSPASSNFFASANTIDFTRNAKSAVSKLSAATSKLSVRICNDTYAPTNDGRAKSSIERGELFFPMCNSSASDIIWRSLFTQTVVVKTLFRAIIMSFMFFVDMCVSLLAVLCPSKINPTLYLHDVFTKIKINFSCRFCFLQNSGF